MCDLIVYVLSVIHIITTLNLYCADYVEYNSIQIQKKFIAYRSPCIVLDPYIKYMFAATGYQVYKRIDLEPTLQERMQCSIIINTNYELFGTVW